MSSHVTNAMSLYYASTLNLLTTFCFLLSQDIKFVPTNTQYLEVDCVSMDGSTESAH